MKEYIKKDIGDYFFERTNDFEMSPPEHLWENIRKEIAVPQIPARPHFLRFWQYYAISAIIGIIAVSVYYSTKTEIVTPSNIVTDKASITTQEISTNVTPAVSNSAVNEDINANNANIVTKPEAAGIENKEIIAKNASEKVIEKLSTKDNSNVANNENTKINTTVSNNVTKVNSIKKYNINASSFKNVKQIYFVNDSGEKSIVINNPTVNKFGFYEIDVTNISSGKYRIKIVTDKEEIEHKIESFN